MTFVAVIETFESIHEIKNAPHVCGIPPPVVKAITALYKNTKPVVPSADGETETFDIWAGVPHGDTFAPYLFVIVLDYACENCHM